MLDFSAISLFSHKRDTRSDNATPATKPLSNPKQLLSRFIESRREGLSLRTIETYQGYLNRAIDVVGIDVSGQDIAQFLKSLTQLNKRGLLVQPLIRGWLLNTLVQLSYHLF